MKYLYLPINIFSLWYWDSLKTFWRTWKNSILYLEEDLAVGLMWKLLFVPLFHDSTIMGRILSLLFRLTRILIGLLAFFLATILIILLAMTWLLLPLLAIFLSGTLALFFRAGLFSGLVLVINYWLSHPHQKVKEIKTLPEIWQCSLVKKSDLEVAKLLKTDQVRNLLAYLEQIPEWFLGLSFALPSEVVLKKVWELGKNLGVDYLEPEHFFVAMVLESPDIKNQLLKIGLKVEDFPAGLGFLEKKARLWRRVWIFDEDFRVRHLRGVNRGWLGVPTPNLDLVSEDLTRLASRNYIPDFVGRKEVVDRVIKILSLEKGKNVLVVGEPGSGKSELVEYLAKLIISGDAPVSLATRRLVSLDLTKLLSGVTSQGELAERVKNVFEDIRNSGNIIIFVDEIHELGMGEVGASFNLYSLMLPYLESDDFQFISTTEPANFSKTVEKNGSFVRVFTKVDLSPATTSETIEILQNQAIFSESSQKVKTSLLAMQELADLSAKYIHDQVLPDAALHTLQECLKESEGGWIKKSVVEKVIGTKTHLPIEEIKSVEKTQLLHLEELIHKFLIDQEEAVLAVAKTLRRAAANLREKNRPIGSFLFVGPTGVGKTELAKILAKEYFLGKGNFFRLDMSEYQVADSANKLIGNSGEEGQLTEAVRQNPYSLILLDEFEKADPKILTLFLQVLDDGRLTDGQGRTVDFSQTIIIATSNAGSLLLAQGLGQGQTLEKLKSLMNEELLKIFRPELLNRFDEVVLFKPLSPADLQKIVQLKLRILQEQLKSQGYLIDFNQSLVTELAQKGYDPVLGARPLSRLIQDTLEAKLSTMILEGKLPKGEKLVMGSL